MPPAFSVLLRHVLGRWADPADMLTSHLRWSDICVTVFHHQVSSHANQDRWLVQPLGGSCRVGVVDGVTPWRAAVRVGDPAQWAAAVCLKHLALPGPVMSRLLDANEEVHDPSVSPSRCQAMAAAAAADFTSGPDGVVGDYVVSADCEVWAVEADQLVLVAGGQFVTDAAASELSARQPVWEGLSFDERLVEEAVLLEDPGTQVCHAVGRYAAPTLLSGAVSAHGVVLASDGACLSEAVAQGVAAGDLGQWIESVAQRGSRDDLTCALITAA